MPYEHGFIGGFAAPRPQFVDIDGDGTFDLFVPERSNQLMYLENVGTPGEPRYEWRTDRSQGLEAGEWTRFVDLDGDGLVDLLAEEPYNYVRVYRNEGTAAEPRFEPDPSLEFELHPYGAPAFADLTGDGVAELVAGGASGGLIYFERR